MFCFVLSSTSEFTMVAPLKFLSVYSCRVLWRRALILVLGFALVFSQDSDSVSVELSPPAEEKKKNSLFSPLPALVRTAPLMISLSLAPVDTYFKQCAPPTLAFIKVWQPCQYPVKKAILCLNGRNKCGHKSKYGWGVVRIVKLYAVMWVLCTESVQAICGRACLMPSNYSPVCGTFISTRNYALPRLKICRRDDGWKAQKMNQI